MPILIVIPFFSDQATRAERLLDCCYWLGGQKQSGHVLLVPAPDVHAEFKIKVRIAAEIGFESVDLYESKAVLGKSTTEKINSLFKQTAAHIAKSYRWPWLYLEPGCVPLVPDWRERLCNAYDMQPKPYFGPHIRITRGQAEAVHLSRVAIYPVRAIIDLEKHCNSTTPFEQASAPDIVLRSTKNRLIQRMDFDGDQSKIRSDAVLIDNDPTGELVEKVIEQAPHMGKFGWSDLRVKRIAFETWGNEIVKTITPEVPPRKRGRPRKNPLPA
jgi:hypothetical protein